jgi:hypothetical protein
MRIRSELRLASRSKDVSATTPAPRRQVASRVQNPCPKSTSHTSAVIGFCDRRAHGTAARLRPHLHHRPQPHLQVTPSSAPAGTAVLTEPASSATPTSDAQRALVDSVLAKVQAAGESAGSSLVGLNRLPREPGAVRLRRSAAGRTPAWSRSPSPPPQELRGVVKERCAATATAASDA